MVNEKEEDFPILSEWGSDMMDKQDKFIDIVKKSEKVFVPLLKRLKFGYYGKNQVKLFRESDVLECLKELNNVIDEYLEIRNKSFNALMKSNLVNLANAEKLCIDDVNWIKKQIKYYFGEIKKNNRINGV